MSTGTFQLVAYRTEQLTGPNPLGASFPMPRAGEQGQCLGWTASLFPASLEWVVGQTSMNAPRIEPSKRIDLEWATVVRQEDALRALYLTIERAEQMLLAAKKQATARGLLT